MEVIYTTDFKKSLKKIDKKIKSKFIDRLETFKKDVFDPILNNHSLIWKLKWKRSINITGDYRAIFKEYPNWTYEFVEFTDIGTHSQLYG